MYDQKCTDLAEGFLEDTRQGVTPDRVAALAQAIQDAIEEWLEENGDRDTLPGEAP